MLDPGGIGWKRECVDVGVGGWIRVAVAVGVVPRAVGKSALIFSEWLCRWAAHGPFDEPRACGADAKAGLGPGGLAKTADVAALSVSRRRPRETGVW